jgi:DNA-binding CsgD family transcriptional regulator
MDRRDVQLSLVQDLLAAPGSEEGWSLFLLHLCDALGASTASFIAHDFSATQTHIALNARTDPEAVEEYATHWHRLDPWASSPVTQRVRPGAVLHGEELVRDTTLRRTAFFNDFGRRHGVLRLAGFLEVSPVGVSCISIVSPPDHLCAAADAALLESLMPSVQRALAIHRRLGGAELMAVHAAAVMDRLPHGVLLVAANGAVLSTNRAADAILRARDGLTCDGRELRGATVEVTGRLRAALAGAGPVLLPRPSGRRPLSVVVAPLPSRRAALSSDGAAAAVFVTDPEATQAPDVETIRRLFDLAPAEARLVQCLVSGESLEEAARTLGLKLETVRSRIKDVFVKTDTHRQADLVRLVLAAAPGYAGYSAASRPIPVSK